LNTPSVKPTTTGRSPSTTRPDVVVKSARHAYKHTVKFSVSRFQIEDNYTLPVCSDR